MISWRWKIIYEWLVCSWRGHDWLTYTGLHSTDGSGWQCRRCLADRPAGRMRRDETGNGWWDSLDVDGNVLE